jgi:hypothetical protein
MTRSYTARVALAALFTLTLLFSPRATALGAAPTASFDVRFGAVEAFRANNQADSAGVRWTRLVFWWSGLQPDGPKSWNQFYFPDDLLQAELNSGRQVVGLLINTPAWAGDGSPNSVPRGLERGFNDPENHWAGFARMMAERYKGRIDHWVIWNEPDVWDPSSETHTWKGSVEQFYQLQKTGYLAIKQGNPQASVGLAGLTYWWDHFHERQQYFERFLEVAERDSEARQHNWFFDAAVLHLYNEPEGLYRAPMLFRRLMSARGLSKPIWINETNVPPWNDPMNPMPRGDFRATLDEQASYLVQAFAYGLAAGAERISVYPFYDSDGQPGNELMGLIRTDGSARPAYQALQTITRYFGGVREAQVERQGEAVVIVLRRDSQTVTVAWATKPRPVKLEIGATAERALLVDKYGGERPIEAEDGTYQLTLEPATANTVNGDPTNYLIGGDPVLIVEGS